MVMVALRARELVFASTMNAMSIELVPPGGIPVIQEGTLPLAQSQPAEVLTLTELPPPPADAL
jgi:hypothetical protein